MDPKFGSIFVVSAFTSCAIPIKTYFEPVKLYFEPVKLNFASVKLDFAGRKTDLPAAKISPLGGVA